MPDHLEGRMKPFFKNVKTPEDKTAEAAEQELNQFKRERAQAIENAVVTTQSGLKFDACEQSIGRMGFRLQHAQLRGDSSVEWVLADSPAGEKTQISLSELQEAFELSVDNMDSQWGRN